MEMLSTVLRYEVLLALTVLAAIIAYRLLTGQINTRGLLRDKVGGRAISTGRLQLLVVTLLIMIYFVMEVLETKKFPNMPQAFVLALGGSNLFYLGGKFYGLLANNLENAISRIATGIHEKKNGG
jgi:hypothetical protein